MKPRFPLRGLMVLVGVGVLGSCEREPTAEPGSTSSAGQPSFNEGVQGLSTTDVTAGELAVPEYTDAAEAVAPAFGIASHAPVIRTYKNFDAWFGENRDNATLLSFGKIPGDDYFVHPLSDLSSGIPAGTAVVLITSNGAGDPTASSEQSAPAAQANLDAFVKGGGVLVVDMGDNDAADGYRAPGASGTPAFVFPDPADDATLSPAALGPDGTLGTADDHPIVKGPDGLPGTGDDLDNSVIDMCCFVAHGNLSDGLTLPADAIVLMTAVFNGVSQPILAEYCLDGGRVILDTDTKEFVGQQPAGLGPPRFLTNLLSYALSPEAGCNQPPNADAGSDQTLECSGHDGATASLDGSGSSDPDGEADIASYEWFENGVLIASGQQASATFAIGTHTVTLRVTDNDGAFDEDEVVIIVQDTQAPAIAMVVSPTQLWPPNHQMHKVASAISASDICDMSPSLVVTVTSSEPENGLGDGDTAPDWEVVANADGTFDVLVRAERSGKGNGRVYTITATSTDASGNTSSNAATVTIPHDRKAQV